MNECSNPPTPAEAGLPRLAVRPATPADAPALARHIVWAEGEMACRITDTASESAAIEKMPDFILAPRPNRFSPQFALVAELDGQAVGSLVSFPADRQAELDTLVIEALARRGFHLDRLAQEGEPGSYYMYTLGVEPAFRQHGVGRRLTMAGEARGRELGFGRFSALIDEQNQRSLHFSLGLGYTVSGELRIVDTRYFRMSKVWEAIHQ